MTTKSISERVEAIYTECEGCWGQSGISSWERQRLSEWRGRNYLTERQIEILEQIEKKAFG